MSLRKTVTTMSGIGLLLALVIGATIESGDDELSIIEAILLGVIEGVTEYLPVSSTAHLSITEDLLGLTNTPKGQQAADAYAIVIQIGAIAAVLGLYRHRISSLTRGLLGFDPIGRRLAFGVIIAFIPSAAVGLALGDLIKDELFSTWPIVAAWLIGGVALLSPRLTTSTRNRPLEELPTRAAALVGIAQVLALWPGTSRSLVTIAAALAIGLSLSAAIEFSFLLGLVTLSAATGYQLLNEGDLIIDIFGLTNSVIGIVTAGAAAWIAVNWMVRYLQQRPLAIFGWYRIAVASLVAILTITTELL